MHHAPITTVTTLARRTDDLYPANASIRRHRLALFRISELGPLVSRERLRGGELQQPVRELAQRSYDITPCLDPRQTRIAKDGDPPF